jgi:hypothetical protein
MVLRRTKTKRVKREIPFSWALLFISILEISVWSIGLGEDSAREFFIRENFNVRTTPAGPELKLVSEKFISLLAFLEEQLRFIARRSQELRAKRVLELDKSVPKTPIVQHTNFTVFLPGAGERETPEEPAARTSFVY